MGVVIKTRTRTVGDVKEEVQYYFELYEDFSKFEEVKLEPSEDGTRDNTDVTEEKYYEVVGNISCHGFLLGEIVTAQWDDDGDALCSNGKDFWYLHSKDLMEVK